MVNFRDPAVTEQDYLALAKLWHTLGGLYIWEFVTTLEYEWDIIRGRIPYQWTIWIYSLARVAALSGIILDFIRLNITTPINCQVAMSFMSLFTFLSLSASTLLIALRVIAIWNKSRVIVTTAIAVWGINAGFSIQGVARLRARWAPEQLTCISSNTESGTPVFISMLVADVALLLIMLVGLYRLRRQGSGTVGLVEHLWRQGVIWLLLGTVAEVPPVVFILLNLNGPFNIMFQQTSVITMTIAGTRMYRSLADFTNSSTDVFTTHLDIRTSGPPARATRQINATSITISQVGVATDIVSELHEPPSMEDYDSHISTDEQTREKPNELGLVRDVERGM